MAIGLAAALLAAVLFGCAAVLQAVAARRYGLVSWLMVLVGVVYLAGWGLHLVAIARLPLYLAQVGIAGSLVVTALVAASVVGEPLAPRHWAAIVAMTFGLVVLVVSAGGVGTHHFDTGRTLGLYGVFFLLLVLGLAVLRLRDGRGGVLLGLLAGTAYGGSPVATRSLVDPRWNGETLVPAFTICLFGVLGFWLYTRALQRTSVTAATAPLVLMETMVPAVLGVAVFGDQVRAGWWPTALAGFSLSTLAALVLCGAETRLEHLEELQPEAPAEHLPR